jgi:hypothetical protein
MNQRGRVDKQKIYRKLFEFRLILFIFFCESFLYFFLCHLDAWWKLNYNLNQIRDRNGAGTTFGGAGMKNKE